MLSMLGWQPNSMQFGKNHQIEAQKQSAASFLSRAKVAQTQERPAQNGSMYYVISSSGSYIVESQIPFQGYAGQSSTKLASGYTQAAGSQHPTISTPAARPDYMTSSSSQQVVSTADRRNSKISPPNKSFKIYPDTPMLDSFIYERSEDAESDTLTCYSNSSVDTLLQFPTKEQPRQSIGRRNSVMLLTGPSEPTPLKASQAAPDSPHAAPISLPPSSSSFAVTSQGRSLPPKAEDVSRPRSGSADSGSSRRRGSGIESERPSISPPGPSPTRTSPPRTGDHFLERPTVPPILGPGPRDVPPPRRNSDPVMQVDTPRKRRLSGAVIPTGFGVLPGERERISPPNRRDSISVVPADIGNGGDRHSPPPMRGAPSPDNKRERYSPDREISVTTDFPRERRVNGAGAAGFPAPPPGSFYDRDRPPIRRGSQSSGSSTRHSPQDEAARNVSFAPGPAPVIRSRTISQARISKDDTPKPIFVAGLETSKMVRFSEKLICPSPIPPDRRRKGWYNKRGDHLWTNDGVFVAPEPGTEYPVELSDYPEAGAGWQNEEGVRIDMQHRLIPKPPLRPALKRGGSSATNQQLAQQGQSRPEARETRVTFSSSPIREA